MHGSIAISRYLAIHNNNKVCESCVNGFKSCVHLAEETEHCTVPGHGGIMTVLYAGTYSGFTSLSMHMNCIV